MSDITGIFVYLTTRVPFAKSLCNIYIYTSRKNVSNWGDFERF